MARSPQVPSQTLTAPGAFAPDAAAADLGRELRRIRKDLLGLTQATMADWLGVATRDEHGRSTSTGKSLVSRFENGRRYPEHEVLVQYAKAPGADSDALIALWTAAGDVTTEHDEPAGDDAPAPAGSAPRRRRQLVVAGAGVAVLTALTLTLAWMFLQPAAAPAAPLSTPVPGATLVFDALGEQSDQTIRIYHGPGGSDADRAVDGTYEDGQRAAVICLTHGRRVTSDPAANESPRSSEQWARIISSEGRISYATMTYAAVSPTTAVVPPCESS